MWRARFFIGLKRAAVDARLAAVEARLSAVDARLIKLHMLSLLQSGLNNPFTKTTDKLRYYMNTSYVLSQMHLGIKDLHEYTSHASTC